MTPSGLTTSVARSCSTEVSMTVPCRPFSIPWAISSSPGASGIFRLPDRPGGTLKGLLGRLAALEAGPFLGAAALEAGPFLGAAGVVALTPAEIGLAADELLQLVEAVEQGLRTRRTAG